MSMVAKILIVLNLILAVLVMGAAGSYLRSAENWKTKYETDTANLKTEIREVKSTLEQTQASLDEAKRAREAAEKNAADYLATSRTLQENNNVLKARYDDMAKNLTEVNGKLGDLQANLDAARQANDKLKSDLDQARGERTAALQAQNSAETEVKRLQGELAKTESNWEATQAALAKAGGDLEAANTVIGMYKERFGGLDMVAAPVKGRVLAADPKMDIYLISVGSKDDLKLKDELTVFRGSSFVARVVVDRLYEDKAAVSVVKTGGVPMKKMDIQQGDEVATIY